MVSQIYLSCIDTWFAVTSKGATSQATSTEWKQL